MNYKNEIEKTAAQVMPHRLADGGYAIPRYIEAGDYKSDIEKIASVEWGFEVAKDPIGNMGKRYQELDSRDGFDLNEEEVDELDDIEFGFSGANEYGYPEWSERGIGEIPLEYAPNSRLADLMNGNVSKYIKNPVQLTGHYSGVRDGERFLTDRDGATEIAGMFDEVINKLPEERLFNREEYDAAKSKYEEVINKRRQIRENSGEQMQSINSRIGGLEDDISKTRLLQFGKRKQLKNHLATAQKDLSVLNNQMDKSLASLPDTDQYRQIMYRASDRDVMELYRDAIKNSLNDNANNLYHMRWH